MHRMLAISMVAGGWLSLLTAAAPCWAQLDPLDARVTAWVTGTAAAAAISTPAPDRPFAEGTWTFQTYGSGTWGDSDKGEIYTAHIGVGYHFVDDLSINLEAIGGWADAEKDDDGGVGGIDLLFRWHFLQGRSWSLYIDGGAGFQLATTNFPSDSHHNFRPQVGLGGTLQITDSIRLMGGARWLHISNAGTTRINNGLDGAQLYAGIMVPF